MFSSIVRVRGATGVNVAGVRAMSSAKPGFVNQYFFDAPSQNGLDETFPGVPAVTGAAPKASPVETTKLSNGVTVVSSDKSEGVASVCVSVKAGSRYETVPGTVQVLEKMAFKSTSSRSSLKLWTDAEEEGIVATANGNRETIVYAVEGLRDGIDGMVSLLGEAVTAPRLSDWEVAEVVSGASCYSDVLDDTIHAAAFGPTSALGHTVPSASDLNAVTGGVLRAHLGSLFTGPRTVVSGVNVAHKDLVSLAEANFGSVPDSGAAVISDSTYQGNLFHRCGDAPHGALLSALGFPTAGIEEHSVGSIAQTLLTIRSADLGVQVNASIYSDVGFLYTAHIGAESDAEATIAALAALWNGLANTAASPEELAKAKALATMNVLRFAESRVGLRESMGHLLQIGGTASVSDMCKAIDSVTAADLTAFGKKAISADPSVATVSDGVFSPATRYDKIQALLK